ncbi:MAG: ATP-binding protein [Bacteroidales bacterium]|nr:ATP-binding protein [Bacteroidales bacterium]
MQTFKRELYLKRLMPFVGKNLIKVITGQRRTGKSYLLRQIIELIKNQDPDRQIIYINKEDYAFDAIRTYADLIEYVEQSKTHENIALFVDEVQDISQFERAIRHFLLNRQYDIYCTGSNSAILSSDIATLLGGRTIEIEVYSLSYPEFLTFHDLKDTNENFEKYLVYGGMPNLTHLSLQDEIAFNYLENLFNTIVVRDVIERHQIRNAALLRNLCEYIADNLGSLVSGKRVSDYLKSKKISMSPAMVIEYLSFLCEAFFVFKVKRSDLQGKKILEVNEKYFFNDIGLRNSLVGFKARDMGKLLENVVFNHLKVAGYKITIGEDRTREVDFVARKNTEILYIQVCYKLDNETTINREFGNLINIKNNYPKFVLSMDVSSTATYQGINHLHVKDFCKSIISLNNPSP